MDGAAMNDAIGGNVMRLRIESDAAPINEYRIIDGHVEFRRLAHPVKLIPEQPAVGEGWTITRFSFITPWERWSRSGCGSGSATKSLCWREPPDPLAAA